MNKCNLILLPGLLNDYRLWEQQFSGLSDIANVIVADLSGSDSMAGLTAAVLEQAPPGPFALAGLSMGGYTALEVMRRAPERVIALALLDTSARPDTPEATEGRKKMIEKAQTDFPAVIDGLLPKLLHPEHLSDKRQVDSIKAQATTVGKDVFARQQHAIIGRIDSRPSLTKIHCPTLILCGREDAITPVDIHEEMHAAIAGSTLVVIEKCGHLSPLGQPEKVNAALKNWLSTISH